MKCITIVKRVCTAYEKSSTAQTNSTNVSHMKRQTWQQHTYGFHGFIVSMKDDQKQFSSHYTKILPESKAKKKKKKITHTKKKPQTENKAPKTNHQKQKPKKSKRKAQNHTKKSKPTYKNKEQTTKQAKKLNKNQKHKTKAKTKQSKAKKQLKSIDNYKMSWSTIKKIILSKSLQFTTSQIERYKTPPPLSPICPSVSVRSPALTGLIRKSWLCNSLMMRQSPKKWSELQSY